MNSEYVNVFCINGVIVKALRTRVESCLPLQIMPISTQKLMQMALQAQGLDVHFLSPEMSDDVIRQFEGELVKDVNKVTANIIGMLLSGKPVFQENEDGVLR